MFVTVNTADQGGIVIFCNRVPSLAMVCNLLLLYCQKPLTELSIMLNPVLDREVRVSSRGLADSVDVEDRWLHAVLGHIGRLGINDRRPMSASVKIDDKATFEGVISCDDIDHMTLCRLRAEPNTFTSIRVSAAQSPRLMACFQISGRTVLQQGRRSVSLHPGQWTFVDGGHPFQVNNQTTVTQYILSTRSSVWTGLTPFSAVVFHGTQGLKKLVFDFVCSVVAALPLPSSAKSDVAASLDRLLYLATLEDSNGNAPPTRTTVTLNSAMAFIQANLQDRQLSADTIARSLGCSSRTVYRLFRSAGVESLERFLWRQRVDACTAEMERCDAPHMSLTELAYQYGFPSSASFSRTFRQIHGVSPSQWRRVRKTAGAPPNSIGNNRVA